MSVKLLIDMNLPPSWVAVFEQHGWPAVHWSTVGNPGATDQAILSWAKANQYVVFTHDLDFGTLLAATRAEGPSVIQMRTQDVLPANLDNLVIAALRQYESLLEAGALIVVDESTSRARILPLNR